MTKSSWAVATPHHAASAAAAEVFGRGGNAVDAALAAAAMLTVVYPNQNSVAGDLLALVGTSTAGVRFVNAGGAAPRHATADDLAARHRAMPVEGAESVTVPGTVSGWFALAEKWGRLGVPGLAAALESAATAARDGVPVSPGLARDLTIEQDRLAADPGMRATFFRDGRVLGAGQTLTQPELARSLSMLAADGADAMYRGPLAASLVRFLAERGSAMTTGDFDQHAVDFDDAHGVVYAGEEYLSTAANSQGLYFLEALNALEHLRRDRPDGRLSPLGDDAGTIATVLAAAAGDRDRFCADPRFAAVPVEWLLSPARAAELAAVAASAGAGRSVAALPSPPSGDTVAVVCADGDGNWVSLIQSVFHCFGAALLDPATGLVLHNRGASFTLEPGAPNRFAGGKRPMHTLMPVLVRDHGRLVGAHGTMGGRAQPQIHAHLALNIARGLPVGDAVSSPRWVLGPMEAGVTEGARLVRVEADVPAAAATAITAAGLSVETLPRWDDGAGHAQVIRLAGTTLHAATDPRADGSALTGPTAADGVARLGR